MHRKASLKTNMIIGGVASVVVPFIVAGIVIYIQLSSALLEMSEEKSVHYAEDVSLLIQTSLLEEIRLAKTIASDPDIKNASISGDYQKAQSELEAIHASIAEYFFTFFLADKNGIIRADPLFNQQIGLDISDRPYFLEAKEGRTSIAGPFLARGGATPGQTIIVVAAPIEDEFSFYGAAVIAFDTDFIKNILAQNKSGRTGYASLVNSNGIVLAPPRNNVNLSSDNINEIIDEGLGEILEKKEDGLAFYSYRGKKWIAGISHMKQTGWIIVFSQAMDEIMGPVKKVLLAVFFSGIVFLLITIVIIALLSAEISNPLLKIMDTMKQVTKHSTEIIVQIGLDKKILFTNPAYEKITGHKSDTIVGSDFTIKAVNNKPECLIWESLESKQAWSGRIEIIDKNSERIVLDAVITPIIDDRNHIQGYLEIGRDITDELLAENRLQQAQKLEAIGVLAGGIAHDFNNILGVILGYAELSLMAISTTPEGKDNLRQIILAAERGRDLVNQILTFSRKTEVELRPLAPNQIINEAVKLLRASIPTKIDIQLDIDCHSLITAEPTQLYQVIMNLIMNASHAIGDNPGTIMLELKDIVADEEFVKTHPRINPGKHIHIRISDTGSGMDVETLEHIFEPFFTTKSQESGTGLGLSVVHGIVNNMAGTITVNSEAGKGAVFNVFIPCLDAGGIASEREEASIRFGSERILILDDEAAIVTAMQDILTLLGYRATAYTDSSEALEALMLNPDDYDIVLTDYSMPLLTGLELAKKIKESDIQIPIILTSGYIEEEIEMAARSVGISELILKPINTYQLTDAIQKALNQKV